MTAASSIAQFMAILGGGVNPSLLRQNGTASATTQTGQNNTDMFANFEKFLAQSSAKDGQDIDSLLARLNGEDGQEPLPSHLATLLSQARTAAANAQSSQSVSSPTSLTGQENRASHSPIWNFIQQQANNNAENQLVLSLSEKGIPDDMIKELQSIFGANDLITIVRDPQMSAQLDDALKTLKSSFQSSLSDEDHHLNTDTLVPLVYSILEQNKVDIKDTLSFTVDTGKPLDSFVDTLLNNSPAKQQDIARNPNTPSFTLTNTQDTSAAPVKPLQLAMIESQIANGDEIPQQITANTSGSVNPFALKNGGNTEQQSALKTLSPQHAEAGAEQQAISVADRLSALNKANTNQNAQENLSASLQNFTDAIVSSDGETLMIDGEIVVPFEAGFKTASQATNPLMNQAQASQPHPASQTAALSLTKMAQKAIDGETQQHYRLQLDPPEMGRIDIKMEILENSKKMKVVIVAEKTESLGLLQRDAHNLVKAMHDAGFDNVSNSDLSFDLSQNGESMNDQRDHASSRNQNGSTSSSLKAQADMSDGDYQEIDTQMSVIIDPVTGQQSVNMLV